MRSDTLPEVPLITTAFVIAIADGQILLAHIDGRGWSIPGGHIERGETPEEAARREIFEETGAEVGDLTLVGYHHMVCHGDRPEKYYYPFPESYQVFYTAPLLNPQELRHSLESTGAKMFTPAQFLHMREGLHHKLFIDAVTHMLT
ncbi:MAG: NUDIX domain-containing protein [Proteobacteria bacterium]|nr:NUDIX domain-containing protein [Pseudomonadota bacterium]